MLALLTFPLLLPFLLALLVVVCALCCTSKKKRRRDKPERHHSPMSDEMFGLSFEAQQERAARRRRHSGRPAVEEGIVTGNSEAAPQINDDAHAGSKDTMVHRHDLPTLTDTEDPFATNTRDSNAVSSDEDRAAITKSITKKTVKRLPPAMALANRKPWHSRMLSALTRKITFDKTQSHSLRSRSPLKQRSPTDSTQTGDKSAPRAPPR